MACHMHFSEEQILAANRSNALSRTISAGISAVSDALSPRKSKKEETELSADVFDLPRGGVVVMTALGPVQFGMPPETVKDHLIANSEVPTYYVLPSNRFDRRLGINLAEFEFPAYFNFFCKKKKVKLVCTEEGRHAVAAVFQETLLGPQGPIDLTNEVALDFPSELVPNLRKELDFFARNPFNPSEPLTLDTLVDFVIFDPSTKVASLSEAVQIRFEPGRFVVLENGTETAVVEDGVKVVPQVFPAPTQDFEPPMFGVTVLGSSHGFDPQGSTSGYVLWVNGRGIMVDPPPHSSELLKQYNIPSRLIDGIILSHCHADHDSGSFQKILAENRITLYTTPTILNSFVRKYSALLGTTEQFIRRLFMYRPVCIGENIKVHGGEFRFFYSLHTIPCLGFELYFGGKSIYFSGDTCNDPGRMDAMVEKGVLTKARRDFLVTSPWHHTVILHECGVPPIHTPVQTLLEQPDSVKERLYLVHCAAKDVPKGCGIKCAESGVQNTIRIEVRPPKHAEAIRILELVNSIEIFRNLRIQHARDMLQFCRFQRYAKDEVLIEAGTPGDKFFVIVSGKAKCVPVDDGFASKFFVSGDYFGETSIVLGQPRNASVFAVTEVEVLVIERYDFLYLFRNTTILDKMIHISNMRASRQFEICQMNTVLREATLSQLIELASVMELRQVRQGEWLWQANQPAMEAYLIERGNFYFVGTDMLPFTSGAFLGNFDKLGGSQVHNHSTSVRAEEDGAVFAVKRADLQVFFKNNPGLFVAFLNSLFVE